MEIKILQQEIKILRHVAARIAIEFSIQYVAGTCCNVVFKMHECCGVYVQARIEAIVRTNLHTNGHAFFDEDSIRDKAQVIDLMIYQPPACSTNPLTILTAVQHSMNYAFKIVIFVFRMMI